jgi:ABC-type sugar transport system ATPase subunit
MAEVTFKDVDKIYPGDVQAVKDLSLDIQDSEFLVLVGPSGCGKTTALRMVAGLEEISDGTISIGGRVVNTLTPRERDIAMVFQNYALYPHLSVAENIAFGLRLRKEPKSVIQERVAWAGKLLDLTPYLDRKPKELSGGQRQRVAMGRAIVRKPQVFLMDEPLSNLDAKLRTQTRGEIKRLQGAVGTTTVYVTHDQVEAMTMGDRIAVLRDGELQQVGTPEELYERPANVFVGGFIGSPGMSFLPGDDGGQIGVRPEHVRPWQDGLHGPIDGRVAYVEALGRETLVGVDADGDVRLVAVLEGRADLEVGAPLRVGLLPAGMQRFAADGRRV